MSSYVTAAVTVLAPTAGRTYAQPLAATSQRYVVPSDWRGSYVRFHAVDVRAWILFGTVAVVAATADSTVASMVLTVNATTAVPVEPGTYFDLVCRDETHFAVLGDEAAGRWIAFRNSPKSESTL
jgi:hypothetical protein